MLSRRLSASLLALAAGSLLLGALACARGPRGPAGPGGDPDDGGTPTDVERDAQAPVLLVAITEVEGGSGVGGFFEPGDVLAVTFTLTQADGTPWGLSELSEGLALVSGPTFNYQRVLPAALDVLTSAEELASGNYRYRFAPLPATYAAPYNDTGAFGIGDGELTGLALFDGTYTLGLSFAWDYSVEGVGFRRVGEATADFLVGGGARGSTPRAVVAQANCERCHVELQAHAGRHREVTLCLACHTSGSEDLNDASVAGGTPGVSIDSRVLFHKLHSGVHLPTVQGIEIDGTGMRDYTAAPVPYRVARGAGIVRDFSDVRFPAFPNAMIPMPRDFGYSSLDDAERAKEDPTLTGISSCFVCHGDPDGSGALEAPEQGDLVFVQPSRRACGACHDDVDFNRPYNVNLRFMPPQFDDAGCVECHVQFDDALQVENAHLHPLRDAAFDAGLVVELAAIAESGAHDGDGAIEPGEKVALTLDLTDGTGASVDPADVDGLRAALSGPTWNQNVFHATTIPVELLAGGAPYTIDLPTSVQLEWVGDSSAALGDVFTTALAPHLDLALAPTSAWSVSSASGGSTLTAADADALQNFIDVLDASGFARDDVIAIGSGTPEEEYLRIQWADANRLWFSSLASSEYPAGLTRSHGAGTAVAEVQLSTLAAGVDYALDAPTGTLTELVEIGAGRAVLISYWSDFVVPSTYPGALHDSPDLGVETGEWSGLGVVPGTYRVTLTAWRDRTFSTSLEDNAYRVASPATVLEFPGGDASLDEPYALVDSAESCNECHQDLSYHEGTWHGLDTCLECHGTAGAEDRPRSVAENAPPTPGVTTSFRTLLHRLHRGRSLAHAADFLVVGEGAARWPDNFTTREYSGIGFPAQPGATLQCTKCHGGANAAWKEPAPRAHPGGQETSTQVWRAVCVACHDSDAAVAHADANTAPSGAESCSICHGPGQFWSVEVEHIAR